MMSFLKNIFGGGSAPKRPEETASQGLEKLSEQADMLKKRIEHIEAQIQEQEEIAKKYATTNKTRALAALKKKKQLQDNRAKAEGTLDNIENQKDMLENASSNAAILKTMAHTAQIVKKQHDNLDINKVEDIVDDIREQKEISEEIANILSQNTVKQHDDDELLKELQELQQEEIDKKLLDTNKDILPSVPTQLPAQPSAVPSSSKKDEEELDELKKWASAAQ
uniref:Charged multivesicular body protein 4c n=1 Tax=Aceria tosichella TaxID=561515 RepID=A0A6G1S5Q1_9ACAR